MFYINIFISFLAIASVIFIHELGHFLFFRYFGISVQTFSVGFGGDIYSFRDRFGTKWVLAWIPFGGFVQPLERAEPGSNEVGMEDAHPLSNVLIAFAGPLFNFFLSFFIIFSLALFFGLPEMRYQISHVAPFSPAASHDFKSGDIIVDILSHYNGEVVQGHKIAKIKDGSVVVLNRSGEILSVKIHLSEGQKFRGLAFQYSYRKLGFWNTFLSSLKCIFAMILFTFSSVFLVFKSMFFRLFGYVGEAQYLNISGTVGVITAMQHALVNGWGDFFVLLSQISISLGVFNLFPIPMLDGGQILIYFFEWVLGSKIHQRFRDFLIYVSLIFVLMIFTLGMVLDLYRLRGAI